MDFHMLRKQGLSIHKIAALRGVSRNAVRRALRSQTPPTGKPAARSGDEANTLSCRDFGMAARSG